jgi:hypothetical protein
VPVDGVLTADELLEVAASGLLAMEDAGSLNGTSFPSLSLVISTPDMTTKGGLEPLVHVALSLSSLQRLRSHLTLTISSVYVREQLIYLVVLCIAVISLYWDIKTLVSTRKNTSFEVKVINQDQQCLK